ncbi:MAG: response regulator [Leptolyngbya sp. UWPOB_LEPTO1]|uniref:response regulator n=1 Tax=Leptolyngbya sp. UWPOB_LEPTO1 TaxID=2815653 RepID=UPI001AD0EA72|nr:response regulator [Leptolyngbya sp. UWPOB_LEPTO1]MBN8559273.1 response regulator [Leptolyngbya sp. UWPOB_LEPTO1]
MKAARILVVEDESVVAWHVQEALQSLGHEVIAIATTARQAIDIARSHHPDLVLMDICLQGKNDGVYAAEELYLKLNVPVVFLTAHSDEQTLGYAMKTSPFGYLVKPFKDADLHLAIQVALQRYRLEAAIKATQRWYATTLVSIGDATIATDVDGFITFMNPAAEFFTGWTQEQALGEFAGRVLNLVHEETGEAIDNPILAALCRGDTITLPSRAALRSRDGTERPVGDSASPIRDRDGAIIGGVMVFQDMSDRRQRESKLDAQRQILEATQSLLTQQLKSRTEQLHFSIAADRLRRHLLEQCHTERSDFLQWMLQEVVTILKAERGWIAFYDSAATVATIIGEFNLQETDVRSRLQETIEIAEFPAFYLQLFRQQCWVCPPPEVIPPVYATANPLIVCPIQGKPTAIGEIGLVLPEGTLWTDYKADLIGEIVTQVVQAYQTEQQTRTAQAKVRELEHLKTLQDDFIEALSHELRTPLTNMRMAIELMQRMVEQGQNLENPNPQHQRLEQYLKILQQEWHESYNLVTDLLVFQTASATNNTLPMSEIHLQNWLAIVLDRFASQTGIAVQLVPASEMLPNIWVHLPTLEKILSQMLAHLHHANPALVIQLQTSATETALHLSASCQAEEGVSQRQQNVSSLRLALLRRFAIELNAKIELDQQSGSTTLTLSLPIRAE